MGLGWAGHSFDSYGHCCWPWCDFARYDTAVHEHSRLVWPLEPFEVVDVPFRVTSRSFEKLRILLAGPASLKPYPWYMSLSESEQQALAC